MAIAGGATSRESALSGRPAAVVPAQRQACSAAAVPQIRASRRIGGRLGGGSGGDK